MFIVMSFVGIFGQENSGSSSSGVSGPGSDVNPATLASIPMMSAA